MDDLLEASVAPATALIYQKCVDKFVRFVRTLDASPHAVFDSRNVELWLTSLGGEGLAHGTVRSHLSALRHHCRRRGVTTNLDTPRIRMLLKGIMRKYRRPTVQKGVAKLSHLRRLVAASGCLNPDKRSAFNAMIAVAFFGFLRPSEYCVTSAGHYLVRGSVKAGKSGHISLKFTTFKHSKGTATVKVRRFREKACCPVRLLRSYLAAADIRPEDPLFDITAGEFRNLLSTVGQVAGLKTKLTPHSFRHGGATWAASEHWPDARIRAHGRWSSDAYKVYVKSC